MHCCFMCLSVSICFHHSLFLHFPCTVPTLFFHFSFTFHFFEFSYTFPSHSFTFLSLFLHCSFTINFPSVSFHFLHFSFTFTFRCSFIVPSLFFYFFLVFCVSVLSLFFLKTSFRIQPGIQIRTDSFQHKSVFLSM